MEKRIVELLRTRASLKQGVFDTTLDTFNTLKEVLRDLPSLYNSQIAEQDSRLFLEYEEVGNFVAKLKIAGDVLVFFMHTNAFMFDRDHKVWNNAHVKENAARCYTGVINIYNFLYDSFRYSRMEDYGYMVARVFVNRERSFFVEGKRQRSMGLSNFGKSKLDKDNILKIVETAMHYSLEFDLLVPPYENMNVITMAQMNEEIFQSRQRTGKRLGFIFKSDDVQQ
ncbi:hypothetical protein [Alkalitalea saponilacus]|uniref:Uncharacterized protein n=1 Tax=Alkalitalea saponilacus TaxID=889453 RepID=A0A1T5HH38_9BACT|nr:hypothetical protein [Alkalitalea saponilacus]ASB48133.1 hypothetical protein CDL62_02735 [Alkalitalea saponilacus]SKC19987.1 hypothetical protein SAMN03080601_02312 [Alkalitalea saponilacus]